MANVLTPKFGSLVPTQSQQLLQTNYLQWTDNGGAGATPDNFSDFAQQYLPEIYEAEVERYGNRTLSGFLGMVGAEMPMTSDQVIWSEQNRLHISYENVTVTGGTQLTIPIAADIQNVISVNDTIVIMEPTTGKEAKGIVTASGAYAAPATGTLTVQLFDGATTVTSVFGAAAILKIFVYGSDYAKGSDTVGGLKRISVEPTLTQFSNSPIIIRNQYVVSGSDTAQIGWVNVATEDGTDGYLWYLKAESETRLRFNDYLEMAMVEGELNTSAANPLTQPGTEGLFAAIETRGNVNVGFTAANGLVGFDQILRNLDTQGAIEENMLFLQRQTALDFDDMLAAISSGQTGGVAYGLYKTDWKYLNDMSTRGGFDPVGAPPANTSPIEGVLVPAGTSTVYDQILGTNIRRPFLHVRYRASQTDDRRMKSWLTGSVGGAMSSTLDAMEVNFLSERCLVTQAANNFVLFKGA